MTLPKQERSGVTPKQVLRAAAADPEAGDHLVEDQERADAVALGPEAGEEPVGRRDEAHVGGDRFDDDARRRSRRARAPVVGRDRRVGHGGRGHAGRARDAARRLGPSGDALPLSARSASPWPW